MATQEELGEGGLVAEWRRLQAEQLELRVELGSERDPGRRAEILDRLQSGREQLRGFDVGQRQPATARPPSLYQFDDVADISPSTEPGAEESAQFNGNHIANDQNGDGASAGASDADGTSDDASDADGDIDIDELLRTPTESPDGGSAEDPTPSAEPAAIVRRGTPPLPAGPPWKSVARSAEASPNGQSSSPDAAASATSVPSDNVGPADIPSTADNPGTAAEASPERLHSVTADGLVKTSSSQRPAFGAAAAGALGALVLIGAGVLIWTIASNRASQADNANGSSSVAGAAAGDPDREAERLRAVFDVLGLDMIEVGYDGSTIQLTGTVGSESEHQAALQAVDALADDVAIDTSGLTVEASAVATTAAGGVNNAPVLTARELALQSELDQITAVTPIIFDAETSQLGDRQLRVLDAIAEVLSDYPDILVTVVGFTDSSGDPATNLELSQARANYVEQYLVAGGIEESRLDVIAHGEDGSTGSPRLAGLERRVDFEVGGTTSG